MSSFSLDAHFSSGYDRGKVGYVHAGSIDKPIFTMDGRVAHYNWRGLPEASSWTNGSNADCTLIGNGSPCTKVNWPGATGVYFRGAPAPGGGGPLPQWVGTLLANGGGSSGMLYRRNRFYDPATGQFNQQDPIGLAGGSNAYGFAAGDPVNYSDPFGLCPIPPTNCLDVAQAAYSVGKFIAAPSVATGIDAAIDVAGVLPGVPSFGVIRRAVGAADDVVDGARNLQKAGRSGKQARLRELADDDKLGSADRGWIRQEINSIDRGQRRSIRNPPGKDLAHRRGKEARKGYGYEHSDLQDRDLHRLQHKHEGYKR